MWLPPQVLAVAGTCVLPRSEEIVVAGISACVRLILPTALFGELTDFF